MNLNEGDVFYHKNINSNLKKGVIQRVGRKYVYVKWERYSGDDYPYKYTFEKFVQICIVMGEPVYV